MNLRYVGGNADLVKLVSDVGDSVDWRIRWTKSVDPITSTADMAPDRDASVISATTTTLLTALSGYVMRVDEITVTNIHASASRVITLQYVKEAGTARQEIKCTLLTQETLKYSNGVWFHYDAFGGVYGPSLPVASQTVAGAIEVADQTEQEAGTALDRAVAPGVQHYHPSAAKFWVKSTGDGTTINASYNVSSLTDTGAGLLTVNIGTDFSSANYAANVTVERTTTSLTVTNLKYAAIRNAGQAGATLLVECWDGTATTAVQEDPQAYHVEGWGDQ